MCRAAVYRVATNPRNHGWLRTSRVGNVLGPGRRFYPSAIPGNDHRRRDPLELQRGMQRPSPGRATSQGVAVTNHESPITSHGEPPLPCPVQTLYAMCFRSRREGR